MDTPKFNCLVIMPFGKNEVDKLKSRLVYEGIIQPAFALARVTGTRIDMEHLLNEGMRSELEKRLKNADLVIADLSGNSPNVSFELGYRRGTGKLFLCISDNPSSAPFWASTFQIINYTKKDAVDRISEGIKKALTIRSQESATIKSKLHKLSELSEQCYKSANVFKSRLTSWRLDRACVQVREVNEGSWYIDASYPQSYISSIFSSIMNTLQPSEHYCTVTNIKFWSKKAVGSTSFLKANLKAIHRGAFIHRVFIVDENELKSKKSDLTKIILNHKKIINKLPANIPNGYRVSLLLTNNYSEALAIYDNFAILRRSLQTDPHDVDIVVVKPSYMTESVGGWMNALKINFKDENEGSLNNIYIDNRLEKFDLACENAIDINDYEIPSS